jgi:energy-coupling factor transporter ATP-binding protein EcfA2
MNEHRQMLAGSNPFSTRFIRPGAIPFWFGNGQCAADMVNKLAELGWRGQIVGPHGSGKSTLVAALVEVLEQAGRRALVIALHDGQRRLPIGSLDDACQKGANVFVIDGFEQLGFWARRSLTSRCRKLGWGLVVTAHRDVGFPTLAVTAPALLTAQAVVDHLQNGHATHDRRIARSLVAEAFSAARGDIREMLFALYDCYEQRDADGAG